MNDEGFSTATGKGTRCWKFLSKIFHIVEKIREALLVYRFKRY